ncbi:zinc ABC transporter substrate-binding protein ZnuA [Agrobacterium vitis]|nr:zinc ABC transporter substrate-binding protein ZnuA [Agrobacterium vitis]NSZ27166.1 zinc ABC transporter substrate-binding protein ZnuA [Agrobacterium vitis]OHZ30736.1 zinc ABC transporter substrate-binding protein [Agrobacterium vitis]UJL79206.1 zinc ABC transporter substrate-binding protein ZnuA [Agrobacterium vitis]UJL84419.1 zinc ABC transporter substrate-binding protein ZnuA [Agrobacterium vitis]
MPLLSLIPMLLLAPGMAAAAPDVVASIKPVNSIVAAIMKGAGTPHLLVEGAGSPHDYSLKPSKAKALQQADLIFWVGPGLETFLDKPLDALAGKAKVVALAEAKGVELLPLREGGPFEAHDDGDAHEAGHGHDHDKDHGHSHDDEHGTHDMHIWLDPDNAKAMAATIAETLSTADKANAPLYAENLTRFQAQVDAMDKQIATMLAPVKDKPFIVFHDAYQYFERRYHVTVAGSVTVSPEKAPGAERVSALHAKIKSLDAACIFAEPQFTPKLIKVVSEGSNARTGTLDPLGTGLADGPDLYPALMTDLATAMATCLKG